MSVHVCEHIASLPFNVPLLSPGSYYCSNLSSQQINQQHMNFWMINLRTWVGRRVSLWSWSRSSMQQTASESRLTGDACQNEFASTFCLALKSASFNKINNPFIPKPSSVLLLSLEAKCSTDTLCCMQRFIVMEEINMTTNIRSELVSLWSVDVTFTALMREWTCFHQLQYNLIRIEGVNLKGKINQCGKHQAYQVPKGNFVSVSGV